MKTDTGLSLRVSRTINADPDTVFRAWTTPRNSRTGGTRTRGAASAAPRSTSPWADATASA